MSPRQKLVAFAHKNQVIRARDAIALMGGSQQRVNMLLRSAVDRGELRRDGAGRYRFVRFAVNKRRHGTAYDESPSCCVCSSMNAKRTQTGTYYCAACATKCKSFVDEKRDAESK